LIYSPSHLVGIEIPSEFPNLPCFPGSLGSLRSQIILVVLLGKRKVSEKPGEYHPDYFFEVR